MGLWHLARVAPVGEVCFAPAPIWVILIFTEVICHFFSPSERKNKIFFWEEKNGQPFTPSGNGRPPLVLFIF